MTCFRFEKVFAALIDHEYFASERNILVLVYLGTNFLNSQWNRKGWKKFKEFQTFKNDPEDDRLNE